jgi:cytochrome c556
MRKLILGLMLAGMAGVGATAVAAADDPIATRKAIMDSVGAAAGLGGGMMKGEIAYSPAAGKSVIATMDAAAHSFGSFFPEGSDKGDTTASPKIWQDPAAFDEAIAKLAATTSAAVTASGKNGPADVAAFKAAMGPVFGNCKSCHEAFRVKK